MPDSLSKPGAHAGTRTVIDWRYTRQNCTTCQRAEEFLKSHKLEAKEVVDARKNTLGSKDALKLASSVEHIYASKGSRKTEFDLSQSKPSSEDLLAAMLGPTGNLRAPIIKSGKTLLVGFDMDNYKKVLT